MPQELLKQDVSKRIILFLKS